MRTLSTSTLGAVLGLLLASPADAVDGVLEINQTCAVNTGCFAGDAAGFPVTISASGSYRLTSDVGSISPAAVGPQTDVIEVVADHVILDLNGFTVRSSGGCTGGPPPTSCTATGTLGDGVESTGTDVTIRNGSIVDAWNEGLRLGDLSFVEDVRVTGVSGNGIRTGEASQVIGSASYHNLGLGIVVGAGTLVRSCVSRKNGLHGIRTLGPGTVVSGSSAEGNGGWGLFLDSGTAFAHNALANNTMGNVSGGIQTGGNVCGAAPCP